MGSSKLSLLLLWLLLCAAWGQEAFVTLRVGSIRGNRVPVNDPERSEVYSFLGIPYAKPPVNELRFRSPEAHPGWNRTLIANRFGPACPQLQAQSTSEDCLTLNIWVPEIPRNFAQFPVVVILAGEFFERGATARVPGEDLAAKDIVVVTVNYRLHLLGFLSLEDPMAPGNMGLEDQRLALTWVQENIEMFGGDPRRVTLLGHSAGAASALLHHVSPKSRGLYNQLILMGGTGLAPWALSRKPRLYAQDLAKRLACPLNFPMQTLDCLRLRPLEDLLQAYEQQRSDYNLPPHGAIYGPVVDKFLPSSARQLPRHPRQALQMNMFPRIPCLVGGTKDEGLIALYYFGEIHRQSYQDVVSFFLNTAIPLTLELYGLVNSTQSMTPMKDILEFLYSQNVPVNDKDMLLKNVVKFFTDSYFASPMAETLKYLTRSERDSQVYAYELDYPTVADIYGNSLQITGSGHGNDLLYLLSPSMYQVTQQGRGLTFRERNLVEDVGSMWAEFISKGKPQSFAYSAEEWTSYAQSNPEVFALQDSKMNSAIELQRAMSLWTHLLPLISEWGSKSNPWGQGVVPPTPSRPDYQRGNDPTQPYQAVMWVLVVCVVLLVLLLVTSVVCVARTRKHRDLAPHFPHR